MELSFPEPDVPLGPELGWEVACIESSMGQCTGTPDSA